MKVAGVVEGLSCFLLNMTSISAFVKYTASSSDGQVGRLATERLSTLVGVIENMFNDWSSWCGD